MTNMHGVKGWNRKDKMLLFHFHIKSKEQGGIGMFNTGILFLKKIEKKTIEEVE